MKKNIFLISIIISLIIIFIPTNQVRASDGSWVKDAFSAAKGFLEGTNEGDNTDPLGEKAGDIVNAFKQIINGINRVLLIALFGISAIALSVIGIKYMMSAGNPKQRQKTKNSLQTAFFGMLYGFGAFAIWRIAMALVSLILGAF